MLEKVLKLDNCFDIAAGTAATSLLAKFQTNPVKMDCLFLARNIDLNNRGLLRNPKALALWDICRCFTGYIDYRFTSPYSVLTLYEEQMKVASPLYPQVTKFQGYEFGLTMSSESAILSGKIPEALIKAQLMLEENSGSYLHWIMSVFE